MIVIEKAAGLLAQETRRGGEYAVDAALSDYVRKGQAKSRKRVYLVHRLDRETGGVMVVAKSPEVQEYFRSRWNEITEKTYLARVVGSLPTQEGFFESLLAEDADGYRVRSVKDAKRGRLARTEWTVLSESKGTTLVRVALKSGRKNQIRVHFSEAGHPVVGDTKYRGPASPAGLCLHAWRLAFIHPRTGKKLFFETDLPALLQDPATLVLIAAALVGVIIWSIIHSVFVRPFVLTGVLRNYLESGMNDIPDEAAFRVLDGKSSKFKKLHAEAA